MAGPQLMLVSKVLEGWAVRSSDVTRVDSVGDDGIDDMSGLLRVDVSIVVLDVAVPCPPVGVVVVSFPVETASLCDVTTGSGIVGARSDYQ